jgi:hypothetical protein
MGHLAHVTRLLGKALLSDLTEHVIRKYITTEDRRGHERAYGQHGCQWLARAGGAMATFLNSNAGREEGTRLTYRSAPNPGW